MAAIFKLTTILWLLEKTTTIAVTALVIIFQPELRKALEQLGSQNLFAGILAFDDGKETAFTERTANEIVKAANVTAAQQAEQLVGEAQKEAVAIKRRAEQDIETERKKAALELKGDISALALELAGKVVEKELDVSTQQSLIDGFLDDLGDLS